MAPELIKCVGKCVNERFQTLKLFDQPNWFIHAVSEGENPQKCDIDGNNWWLNEGKIMQKEEK